MNIQIFGLKNCFDTKKAERYFKERKISYQFINLSDKGLSQGELKSVISCVGLEALIKTSSRDYAKLNLDKIKTITVREEVLFKNPVLYNTPIVRNGRNATIGYHPEIWGSWE